MEEFPKKRYNIILADPPWSYQDHSCNGGVSKQYKTLSLRELCDLPVQSICEEDCVLFLWSTYPLLPDALKLIEAWGFVYKSIAFQWVKLNKGGNGYFFGLGRWTRGNSEPCLLAVKGKPSRVSTSVSQLIVSRVREHSRKPDVVYSKILELMGDLSRVELFARQHRQGWDVWGDQVPKETQKLIKD